MIRIAGAIASLNCDPDTKCTSWIAKTYICKFEENWNKNTEFVNRLYKRIDSPISEIDPMANNDNEIFSQIGSRAIFFIYS